MLSIEWVHSFRCYTSAQPWSLGKWALAKSSPSPSWDFFHQREKKCCPSSVPGERTQFPLKLPPSPLLSSFLFLFFFLFLLLPLIIISFSFSLSSSGSGTRLSDSDLGSTTYLNPEELLTSMHLLALWKRVNNETYLIELLWELQLMPYTEELRGMFSIVGAQRVLLCRM